MWTQNHFDCQKNILQANGFIRYLINLSKSSYGAESAQAIVFTVVLNNVLERILTFKKCTV